MPTGTRERRARPDVFAIGCAIAATVILGAVALVSLLYLARAGGAAAETGTRPTTAFVDVWVAERTAARLADIRRRHGRDLDPVVAAVAADLAATLPAHHAAARLGAAFSGSPGESEPDPGALTASKVLPALRVRAIGRDRVRILVTAADPAIARQAAELAVGPTLAAIAADRSDAPPRLVLSATTPAGPDLRDRMPGVVGLVLAGVALAFAAVSARGALAWGARSHTRLRAATGRP